MGACPRREGFHVSVPRSPIEFPGHRRSRRERSEEAEVPSRLKSHGTGWSIGVTAPNQAGVPVHCRLWAHHQRTSACRPLAARERSNSAYEALKERGAEFLTPPYDWGGEVRCFLRDPDGHLIELSEVD
jgi:catechol 2,3-dioxygenase-like lactoylglutathione lyase family enzyme